ncbi:MAG: YVTN family beta-propeller protein [Candidatus Azotimanducaceae bacterium]|jgi:YVTN family beta-propeller protein
MKNTSKLASMVALAAIAFISCKQEEEQKEFIQSANSAYIINEGNFGAGNGDISYVNLDNDSITTELFNLANDVPAGEVQSFTIVGDKGYIVAGGSNKIEVVNMDDFTSITTISGLSLPRYMVVSGNTGYVSEWVGYTALDTGRIAVIDLNTNAITETINVSKSPDKMLIYESKLYVVNKDTNLVSVIDLSNNTLEQNIVVPHGPNSLVVDNNNNLRILCSGRASWDAAGPTTGALVQIENGNLSTVNFPNTDGNPSNLLINKDGDMLYYNYNGVCKMASNSTTITITPEIAGYYYGMAIDQNNEVIYAFDANGFVASGDAIRLYANGTIDTLFSIGLIPNNASFVN